MENVKIRRVLPENVKQIQDSITNYLLILCTDSSV